MRTMSLKHRRRPYLVQSRDKPTLYSLRTNNKTISTWFKLQCLFCKRSRTLDWPAFGIFYTRNPLMIQTKELQFIFARLRDL